MRERPQPGTMSRRHLALPAGILAALALAVVPAAHAHSGGKAVPRISAVVAGKSMTRDITVRLTDADDGDPIDGANVTVAASMTRPHVMSLAPEPLPATGSGTYGGRIQLLMPATWTIRIGVSGKEVVPASASVETKATLFGSDSSTSNPGLAALPTRIDAVLVSADYETMAVLWIHGLASMGWILGVLVMAIALATHPSLVAAGIRPRLARWYRRVGVWLHWALVPVIVLTGIYNTRRVTPFTLSWTPGGFGRLSAIPYGELYEGILFVKLTLFVVLLVTGTMLLRRTLRADGTQGETESRGAIRLLWSGLGVPGVVYLATIPLILAAAMALRYVHILSHVAVALNSGR